MEEYPGGVYDRALAVKQQVLEAIPGKRREISGSTLSGPFDHRPGNRHQGCPRQGPFPQVGDELVDRRQMTALHMTGYILAL